MRVAVNAEQLLYSSPGGIGRYTAQLLTVLPEVFPEDSVVAFTARHPRTAVGEALASFGVPDTVSSAAAVLRLPRALLYEAWVRFGLAPLPSLGEAEVVHAPSVAVPPRGRRPLVVTVHDAAPELYPEAFPRRGRAFHRRGRPLPRRGPTRVIAVSAAAADEIVSNSVVHPDQVSIVHNGVRPVRVDDADLERALRGRGIWQRPYVLWVGSFEPRKGVGTLVAAMAQLRHRRPTLEVETVLVGYEGWLGENLIPDSDRERLGGSLHRIGRVGEDELWALYRGATVFAFPSRHEGFGLPVVEAMSQGTAVVASDIPALREVAGRGAVLLRPDDVAAWADALEGLLEDESARIRLGEHGLARSRELSVEAMVSATRAVYRQVAS